jgi:hypothetical protein
MMKKLCIAAGLTLSLGAPAFADTPMEGAPGSKPGTASGASVGAGTETRISPSESTPPVSRSEKASGSVDSKAGAGGATNRGATGATGSAGTGISGSAGTGASGSAGTGNTGTTVKGGASGKTDY